MPVIDAHQHFWWLDRRPHHWPAGARATLDRDFTPEDLIGPMATAGVDGTILMQSLNDPAETDEYLALAQATDWIRGVVGWVPLHDPVATARALERIGTHEKLVGVRHLINFEPNPDWLLAPAVQEAIGMVAEAGLVFDAVPNDPARLAAVLHTAERYPHMSVVLDHLARPPIGGEMALWAEMIDRAAALPNVSIKLSVGLDVALSWRWNAEELQPFADHALARFGAGRVMAASNWPVSRLAGTYEEIWAGITGLVANFDPAAVPLVMGGTCARIFGPKSSASPLRRAAAN